MTATEIAITEQEKEMYRKLGIDIERLRRQQEWEALKPVRKELALQEALKRKLLLRWRYHETQTMDKKMSCKVVCKSTDNTRIQNHSVFKVLEIVP